MRFRSILFTTVAAGLSVGACAAHSSTPVHASGSTTSSHVDAARRTPATVADRDRARDDATTPRPVTHDAPATPPTDFEITTAIRRAIMADHDLSFNAQNVKIETMRGAVILRGMVNTQPEMDRVVQIARNVAGMTHVDCQLVLPTP